MSFFNPTKPAVPAVPEQSAIVPQFVTAFVTLQGSTPQAANKLYWASGTTAQELAARFGAVAVQKPAFFDMGLWTNVVFSPETQWYLEFPNGKFANAGELAGYFLRNPETQFPGLAESMVRNILKAGGQL